MLPPSVRKLTISTYPDVRKVSIYHHFSWHQEGKYLEMKLFATMPLRVKTETIRHHAPSCRDWNYSPPRPRVLGLKLFASTTPGSGEIAHLVRVRGRWPREQRVWILITAITFSCAAIYFPMVYSIIKGQILSYHAYTVWEVKLRSLELIKV